MKAHVCTVQSLINDLSRVTRAHYIPQTHVREDDVLHSMSVAFLAWQIHDLLSLELDMSAVMQYALVHDVVEVYSGDVNSYADSSARRAKQHAEMVALQTLTQSTAQAFPNLAPTIERYMQRQDDEALFVWSVDKLQALIQGKLDNYRPFYEQGVLSDDVHRVHGSYLAAVYPPMQDLYSSVLQWFIEEYDDTLVDTHGTLRNSTSNATTSNTAGHTARN